MGRREAVRERHSESWAGEPGVLLVVCWVWDGFEGEVVWAGLPLRATLSLMRAKSSLPYRAPLAMASASMSATTARRTRKRVRDSCIRNWKLG